MKQCTDCGGTMNELHHKTPDNVPYRYFQCSVCDNAVLNMEQLNEVATIYRERKKLVSHP